MNNILIILFKSFYLRFFKNFSLQSKLVDNANSVLSGTLKLILQKNVSGNWIDERIVVNKNVTIPALGLIKLDTGKDNLGN